MTGFPCERGRQPLDTITRVDAFLESVEPEITTLTTCIEFCEGLITLNSNIASPWHFVEYDWTDGDPENRLNPWKLSCEDCCDGNTFTMTRAITTAPTNKPTMSPTSRLLEIAFLWFLLTTAQLKIQFRGISHLSFARAPTMTW